MSISYSVTKSLQIPGITVSGAESGDGDGGIDERPTLPAAELGTLDTRTSDTEGLFSVGTGGSYAVSDIIGIKFDSGYSYDGEVVAYTSGSGDLQVDSFAGDVLPDAGGMIYVSKLTSDSVVNEKTIEGDAIKLMAVKSATTSGSSLMVNFYDAATLLKSVQLESNKLWLGESGNSTLTEFTGQTIDSISFYNFNTVSVSANLSGITNNIA